MIYEHTEILYTSMIINYIDLVIIFSKLITINQQFINILYIYLFLFNL